MEKTGFDRFPDVLRVWADGVLVYSRTEEDLAGVEDIQATGDI